MDVTFVELPDFARRRARYFTDDGFRALQEWIGGNPTVGPRVPGGGGLQKVRWSDARRAKGKRGGIRILYYWWEAGQEIWLFTLFAKDEMTDLSGRERDWFARLLKSELRRRGAL